MKKIFGLLLILFILIGCDKKEQLSLESIQNVKSKEELAELLNCDPLDLDAIASAITEINKTIKETSDDDIQEKDRMLSQDGEVAISKEELMSYIKMIDVTPENWKDIFEVQITQNEVKNAFGEVIGTNEKIILDVSNDYYGTRRKAALKLHDNLNDYDFTTDSIEFVLQRFNLEEYYSYPGVNPEDNPPHEDGEIIYGGGVFDINNLTCTQAIGHVYKSSIPEELIYISPNKDHRKYVNYYYTNEESGVTRTEHMYLDYYEFDRLFGIDN